jgi:hypothetical protein
MLRLLCTRRRGRGLGFRFRGWLGGRPVRSRWRRRRFCWLRMSSRLSAPLGGGRSGLVRSRRRSRLGCRRCGLSCGRCRLSRFPHGLSRLSRRRSGRTSRSGSRWGTIGLPVRRRRSRGCCSARRNHGGDGFACRDGFRRGNNGWTAVIDRGKLLVVLCCCLLLLQLRVHRRNALLARCGNFSRQRLASNASGPVIAGAVVGDVNGGIVDDDCIRHRAVVNLDVADAHVVDGTVIVEAISIPMPP